MSCVYRICCGIDVHAALLVCCLLRTGEDGKAQTEIRRFGTTTSQLLMLLDWLVAEGCPVVGMESTGVYWKPIFNILHGQIKVIVANPRLVKPPRGKKTDRTDAIRLSEWLAMGKLPESFVPPPEIREFRDLTRLRVKLVQTRTQSKNRVLKCLEDANIKVANVASDVFGKSGRAMLDALVDGERDVETLSIMAKGVLRKKYKELQEALDGNFTTHHAMLVQLELEQIDLCQRHIVIIEAELAKKLAPLDKEADQLVSIPGVGTLAAHQILAEIGTKMEQFGSHERLASWAGICPGNNESAGKRHSGKICQGNRYLKRVLVQCAWAAAKTDSFLGRTFWRLVPRIGKKRAAVTVGHKILVIIYHLLAQGSVYEEARYDDTEERAKERELKRALKSLKQLGFAVQIDQMQNNIVLQPAAPSV